MIAATTKPFSSSTALTYVDGSWDILREVATIALTETPLLAARLSDALRSQDARGVRDAAHSLKGMLQCLGAVPSAGFARSLEELGRAGDLATAPALVAALETELARFLAALRAELA